MRIAVGIAGGSGAGKSTLAQALTECLREYAVVVEHDWYYRDWSELPLEQRAAINYDHPGALETKLLLKHLDRLLAGESIEAPVYDFALHTRRAATRHIEPAEIVIVEGLHVLHDVALRKRLAVKVFVDAPPGVCLARRLFRDMLERGRTAESVTHQFETTVFPMYKRYVEPSSADADVVVNGDWNVSLALDKVLPLIAAAHRGDSA